MGVFDYITFEAGVGGCPFKRFQTKDTDAQWLDDYFVTPEGRLEHEVYELVTTPREERPYPDAEPNSLLGMCGALTRANPRREAESYTGEIEFYGTGFDGLFSIGLQGQGNQEFDAEHGEMVPAKEREWFSYVARFDKGMLVAPPQRTE